MWYRTGTISVSNGSVTVTGSGTSWIAGAGIGEALSGPDGRVYEIANIVSATQLTLGSPYLGANQSGQEYQIIPTQSYIRDLAAQAAQLVSDYASFASNAGAGKFGDGTGAAPGLRFAGDENTGIRRAGNDDMRLVANGVDQAQVSPAGFSVQDGKLRITGSADASKVAQFEVDGFTAGAARTFALPNVNTTLAGLHNKISDFAVVTSDELAGKVTDASGTGLLVLSNSPTLTGTPTAPTAALGARTSQLATTEFVGAAVDAGFLGAPTVAQIASGVSAAIDQASLAHRRIDDALTFQTQTGAATIAQAASSEHVRTYASAAVALPKAYRTTDYQVVIDVEGALPGIGHEGQVFVQSRATNGFVLAMTGSATSATLRWKTLHPAAK